VLEAGLAQTGPTPDLILADLSARSDCSRDGLLPRSWSGPTPDSCDRATASPCPCVLGSICCRRSRARAGRRLVGPRRPGQSPSAPATRSRTGSCCRAAAEPFRDCRVLRLAGFFRTCATRCGCSLPGTENPRIVLLTPGGLQRNLLRARVPRPLPRLQPWSRAPTSPCATGGLPEDPRRPAAGRRHHAPARRRLLRPAHCGRIVAGRAGARASGACRERGSRQRARQRAGGNPGPAAVPAASAARSSTPTDVAVGRDVVVRPAARARVRDRQSRRAGHQAGFPATGRSRSSARHLDAAAREELLARMHRRPVGLRGTGSRSLSRRRPCCHGARRARQIVCARIWRPARTATRSCGWAHPRRHSRDSLVVSMQRGGAARTPGCSRGAR